MIQYHNLSAEERARWIDAAGDERITLSFYKYHPLPNPELLREAWMLAWRSWDVLGRIYVAKEGVNAQLSLPAKKFSAFREHLENHPFLKGIRLNVAVEQNNKSFLKLKIKVRGKIVADGIDDPTFNASCTGDHLKAKEFNALVESPDTLLIDMRNHYESEIGRFPDALAPDAETFREALLLVKDSLENRDREKPVVMYCTGGIRCEKASAYFKHQGFNQVYQLEGGIIEYYRQVQSEGLENKFKGKNFVFDERRAEKISDDVISKCHLCASPWDVHSNCNNVTCNTLFLICPACSEELSGCCSVACKEFTELPIEKQRMLRKGKKEPLNIFRKR